eukprot:TRINITY_DN101023_c0_g1_i1.p1 TRINITY_DN101023_c0_g1~~TRINITY_DN101023_c0_g1_i1.p1  ORF type:complete len:469 (-),score=89.81 TRINITY_DN101023_c0_g1_i1:26-1432(-)
MEDECPICEGSGLLFAGVLEAPCPLCHDKDADNDFDSWFREAVCAGAFGQAHQEILSQMADVVRGWRKRFPRPLWLRLARHSCETLIKEAREAAPVIEFVQHRMKSLAVQDGPVTIMDLCSGLGFLGMFLAEMLPADRVAAIVLLDQAWPMKGQEAANSTVAGAEDEDVAETAQGEEGEEDAKESTPQVLSKRKQQGKQSRTRLNWDHIYGLPWPVMLTTRRSDLKLPSTHAQIVSKILEPAPGPVLILGVHLCGILSIRALETFNRGPKTVGVVLKPCCLPGQSYMRQKVRWSLGAHSFAASEVCMWGKYNKGQWQGPPKDSLASRFRAWAHNLYEGIEVGSGRKDSMRIPIVEGHYQDAYLMAERPYMETAWPSSVPQWPEGSIEELQGEALVRHILQAKTAKDALGIDPSSSMRTLKRRFTALTKALAVPLEADDAWREANSELAKAYAKLAEAWKEVRGSKQSA